MHIQTDILLINGTYPFKICGRTAVPWGSPVSIYAYMTTYLWKKTVVITCRTPKVCGLSWYVNLDLDYSAGDHIQDIYSPTHMAVCTSDVTLRTYSHPLPLFSEDLCCVFVICCSTQLPAAPHLPACSASTGNGALELSLSVTGLQSSFPHLHTSPPTRLCCVEGEEGAFSSPSCHTPDVHGWQWLQRTEFLSIKVTVQ